MWMRQLLSALPYVPRWIRPILAVSALVPGIVNLEESMSVHVVVTGGSGKAGRATVRALVDSGYTVTNADRVAPEERVCPCLQVDLTDLGQTFDLLSNADAVVHLAAIPAPRMRPDETTFTNNVESTYNVFWTAARLRLKRVVWASSETLLGLPFDTVSPEYAPIDEQHTRYPQTAYALSKLVGEEIAGQFSRWTGIPYVGLRFSNIIEPGDYARFLTWQDDPTIRRWNLWGYVDARDVGQSCLKALEGDVPGADNFIIAAADTVMNIPSRELMRQVYPETSLKDLPDDRATLLSIDKARRMLGYEPRYSWRQQVSG